MSALAKAGLALFQGLELEQVAIHKVVQGCIVV
jgi:hypothetical protein